MGKLFLKSNKIWLFLGTVFGLVIYGATFVNYTIDSTFEKMIVTNQIEKVVFIDESVLDLEEIWQVKYDAIFGVDIRDDYYEMTNSRSDAMKVLTLDKTNNRRTITSLQRNMLIFIPGEINDFDKLNHTYWYGGPKRTLQTFNYNFIRVLQGMPSSIFLRLRI
ncbi:MAG: LCP family protein [Turicibacter sp.]